MCSVPAVPSSSAGVLRLVCKWQADSSHVTFTGDWLSSVQREDKGGGKNGCLDNAQLHKTQNPGMI